MSNRDTYLTQTGEEVQALLDAVPDKATIYAGTTAYWNGRVGYVPNANEIIVYTDYKSVVRNGQTVLVPGIKVGSGNAYVQDLGFADESVAKGFLEHANNGTIHVTAAERALWNNKVNIDEAVAATDGILKFNRN